MMRDVLIYGAGSIGNHLAFACRTMGWKVSICDIDPEALNRTKSMIYPQRYGQWDEDIKLYLCGDLQRRGYDLVIIGTPPHNHLELAIKALKEIKPKLLLIEKPVCTPALTRSQELFELANDSGTIVCVGYNHVLAKNTIEAEKILRTGSIGDCVFIEAGFKEHWGGVFNAHPWLAGPHETYLGFWQRGGGACGEHSHAINIWQHFSHLLDKGRITEVSASMRMIEDGKAHYDQIANISVRTDKDFFGYIVQDVVTEPTKKYLRVQGKKGFLEWYVNWDAEGDAVIYKEEDQSAKTIHIPKQRPHDFKWEIEHLDDLMAGRIEDSPIFLERGLDTMMIISAAYRSHLEKHPMCIDYSKGYLPEAISAAF
ncbi:MAG: Gfo/Idh/MocA family protein [Candidatus Thorarchaeota archaeon]